jgi:hypothetical protein
MDPIQAYMITNAGMKYFELLYHPIAKIWFMETIPEERNLWISTKKGDVTSCTNYRGIRLLCITYKTFF